MFVDGKSKTFVTKKYAIWVGNPRFWKIVVVKKIYMPCFQKQYALKTEKVAFTY